MIKSRDELINLVANRLRESGGRMTEKRECILDTLLTLDRPSSAEQVRIKAELPSSDLVTVYRTLEAFESVGIVQTIPLENGSQLYELTEPGEHYHHLICRECHNAERIDLCVGRAVIETATTKGFSDISHIMEVYGVCADCTVK